MRRALGTAVFSGMLGVTFFGIFLTPVFFVVIDWFGTTPVFRSRTAQKIRRLTLGVLTLEFARAAIRRAVRHIRPDKTDWK